MNKLARRVERQGDLYAVHRYTGERVAVGDAVTTEKDRYLIKSKDGWWQRKRAELVEKNRTVVPALHPIDRRIARAMSKVKG